MDKALKTMIDNMPGKTGKSLLEWKKVLTEKSFVKHSEAVNYLKTEYQVTHGFANTIVSLPKEVDAESEDLVEVQYRGKEALLPIYKALIEYLTTLGSDVTVVPKKGSVSVTRKRQFVLIKPATKSRIDLGLKLKGKPTTERLLNSGPFGTMCTHRVQIFEAHELDDELKCWIEEAYREAL